MNFNHIIPEWKNTGTEPSDSLKNSGFAGGMRPPAAVFNWFWAKARNAITELQTKLSTVDDEVTAVENRASSLESRATRLESRATTAESDISSIKSLNTTQTTNITAVSNRATSLESRATTAESDIDALENRATTAESDITSLENRATTIEGDISTLESGKVDKVSGKGLSANDFTNALKAKLDGIAEGATKITVDSALSASSTNPVQNKAVNTALGNKVDKVSGKGLSTNDYTTAEQTKLAAIEDNATAVGESLAGKSISPESGTTVVAGEGAEIFNDYRDYTYHSSGEVLTGNVATGAYAHAQGEVTAATAEAAHSQGKYTTASALCAHAQGYNTTASAEYAHSQGHSTKATAIGAHSQGYVTEASGEYSDAGGYLSKAQGNYSFAKGYNVIANAFQAIFGKWNKTHTGVSASSSQSASEAIFSVGYGTPSVSANAFTIFGDGACKGATFFGSTGADYPENYEWLDGNPNNEDRRGLFVTLVGEKIRLANADDDYILGVISAQGGFVGNSPMEWHDKYMKDVFGARIQQEVTIPESVDEATGKVIPEHTAVQYVVNPEYDPDKEYIARESRPEWSWVGLVGQIVVVDDGTCQVDSYCLPSENGIATAAAKSAYRVMSRIDENHIKITIK